VLLEGLDQLRNPMTQSGFEPATFQLVASTNYGTADAGHKGLYNGTG
jgi:hypothetical protein